MVVLRSAANPAQLCAYKIGLTKLCSLRRYLARQRGSAYDIRDVHDASSLTKVGRSKNRQG
jgi:uncharacterized protein (DUF885 family)